jgi:5-hydroxyisourate hydrolase
MTMSSTRSPITTHVLDTSLGLPAAGVPVRLYAEDGPERWILLASGITDGDGRIADLLPPEHPLAEGVYRIRFNTASYFDSIGGEGFYPLADVVFRVAAPGGHYHIPLLLSPFGYSTYRGS